MDPSFELGEQYSHLMCSHRRHDMGCLAAECSKGGELIPCPSGVRAELKQPLGPTHRSNSTYPFSTSKWSISFERDLGQADRIGAVVSASEGVRSKGAIMPAMG